MATQFVNEPNSVPQVPQYTNGTAPSNSVPQYTNGAPQQQYQPQPQQYQQQQPQVPQIDPSQMQQMNNQMAQIQFVQNQQQPQGQQFSQPPHVQSSQYNPAGAPQMQTQMPVSETSPPVSQLLFQAQNGIPVPTPRNGNSFNVASVPKLKIETLTKTGTFDFRKVKAGKAVGSTIMREVDNAATGKKEQKPMQAFSLELAYEYTPEITERFIFEFPQVEIENGLRIEVDPNNKDPEKIRLRKSLGFKLRKNNPEHVQCSKTLDEIMIGIGNSCYGHEGVIADMIGLTNLKPENGVEGIVNSGTFKHLIFPSKVKGMDPSVYLSVSDYTIFKYAKQVGVFDDGTPKVEYVKIDHEKLSHMAFSGYPAFHFRKIFTITGSKKATWQGAIVSFIITEVKPLSSNDVQGERGRAIVEADPGLAMRLEEQINMIMNNVGPAKPALIKQVEKPLVVTGLNPSTSMPIPTNAGSMMTGLPPATNNMSMQDIMNYGGVQLGLPPQTQNQGMQRQQA